MTVSIPVSGHVEALQLAIANELGPERANLGRDLAAALDIHPLAIALPEMKGADALRRAIADEVGLPAAREATRWIAADLPAARVCVEAIERELRAAVPV